MMLITEEYRKSQEEFHKLRPEYGTSAARHVNDIIELASAVNANSVLDYGCGKATLAGVWPEGIPFLINYDPCVPEYAPTPPACDLVYCGDVLEHIEPDCLEAVLDHLRELTLKAIFLVICTQAARKTLQDGRNSHLIQEGLRWWMVALGDRWKVDNLMYDGLNIYFAGRPA
jgi:hypothetical protein